MLVDNISLWNFLDYGKIFILKSTLLFLRLYGWSVEYFIWILSKKNKHDADWKSPNESESSSLSPIFAKGPESSSLPFLIPIDFSSLKNS